MDKEQNIIISQASDIISEVKKAVIGKDEVILKVLLAMISGGHILLEDIPGVGKTTMALAFSKALSLDYKRMQFTPDVLPSDVTGFNIFNKQTGRFEYKEGAAICSLFLADEINRTSSKTQSALLELMEEGSVTVDGVTRPLPKPYIVIATENPIGSVGTQQLPESQLDRFIVRLSMGYPDKNSEISILKARSESEPAASVRRIVSSEDILRMQEAAKKIYVDDKVYDYMVRLVSATREHTLIRLGISPRGTVALAAMTRAVALLRGRDFAVPDDVRYIFKDVCCHRLVMSPKSKLNGETAASVIDSIAASVSAE